MSCNWPEVRLGDYINSCLGKMLDKKKNKGTPQPYLGNSNVRWGTFELDDLAEMKFEQSEFERYSLKNGDLVVCEGGEPGRCAIWEGEAYDMKIQKALHRIRPDERLNNYYLYYWFLYSGKVGKLDPYFTGTTIKHLTGRALADLPIRIPQMEVQRQCADVLKSLDRKINHNTETNQTLEQMAQAIFKSWFVDFDPVKAKMNGEQPEGMDAPFLSKEVASLFPEKLVESELGLIPDGWDIGSIKDVTSKVFSGGTPATKNKDFWGGDLPWFSSGETRNNFIIGTEKYITEAGVRGSSTKASAYGDVLIASAGQGHTRGQTSFNSIDCYINQSVVALRSADNVSAYWLYYNLERRYDEMRSVSDSHSSRGSLTTKLLKGMPAIIPSKEIVIAFDRIVESLVRKQVANSNQNGELSALRDTLLPKLLSGEIELDTTINN